MRMEVEGYRGMMDEEFGVGNGERVRGGVIRVLVEEVSDEVDGLVGGG